MDIDKVSQEVFDNIGLLDAGFFPPPNRELNLRPIVNTDNMPFITSAKQSSRSFWYLYLFLST